MIPARSMSSIRAAPRSPSCLSGPRPRPGGKPRATTSRHGNLVDQILEQKVLLERDHAHAQVSSIRPRAEARPVRRRPVPLSAPYRQVLAGRALLASICAAARRGRRSRRHNDPVAELRAADASPTAARSAAPLKPSVTHGRHAGQLQPLDARRQHIDRQYCARDVEPAVMELRRAEKRGGKGGQHEAGPDGRIGIAEARCHQDAGDAGEKSACRHRAEDDRRRQALRTTAPLRDCRRWRKCAFQAACARARTRRLPRARASRGTDR